VRWRIWAFGWIAWVLTGCAAFDEYEDPVYLGRAMSRLSYVPAEGFREGDVLDSLLRIKEARLQSGSVDLPLLLEANRDPYDREVPSLPNQEGWHWLTVTIPASNPELHMMEVSSSSIDSMVVWMMCGDRVLHQTTAHGSSRHWPRGKGFGNFPAFDLPEEPCDDLRAIVGMKSGRGTPIPIRVHERSLLEVWQIRRDSFFMFYLGIMVVMLLYNAFLFFTLEDRTYLLYILFLVGVAGSQFALNGYSWMLGLNSHTWLGSRFVHFVGMYSGITTFLFIQRFLDLKRLAPGYYKTLNIILLCYVPAMVFLLWGKLNVAFDLINMPAMFSVLVLPAARHTMKRGHKSARFLLVAFSVFLVAVTVFALREFIPAIPHNWFTDFLMPIGSIVEVVLLSLALGDRINQFKRESEEAREEQLRISRLNEQIMQEQNAALEQRVQERTERLQEQNNTLESTLAELRMAQNQLVQSEKLASIGQLTAGIAHELNNPINFVSSSAQSLRRDFEDVASILQEVERLDSEGEQLDEAVRELHALVKRLDLEFTMKEIEELLTGIEDGAIRTSEIVKGLRIFSRMDGDAITRADINELLESTLVILRSSLKEEVQLHVDLAPNLETIECQPGKLNQVFMNLITNAAQATKDQEPQDRQVRVRTRMVLEGDNSWVQVAITDNGTGMSKEVLDHIFDPFYTTKDVGEGTGLGLSIVKGILDDHHAVLHIDTQPGEGSTFLISFPA
jgi:two-component system NtrC family sensor kinase